MPHMPTTDTPAISVLIPVYNVERYLARCLDSVLAQSFTDFEVICVNDASPDTSAVILASYAAADPRIRIINHPRNLGPMVARSNAVAAAKGEYLFFLDSDDYIPPSAFKKLYSGAEKSGAGIIVGNMCLLNASGGKCIRHRAEKAGDTALSYLKSLLNQNTPSLCGNLFRRDLFCNPKLSNIENQNFSEDRILLTEILTYLKPGILQLPAVTYYYWQHESSSCHRDTDTEQVRGQLNALFHCYDLVNGHNSNLQPDNDRFMTRNLALFIEKGYPVEKMRKLEPRTGKLLTLAEMKKNLGKTRAYHTYMCMKMPSYRNVMHRIHKKIWELKGVN